jgi:hypothetical protein
VSTKQTYIFAHATARQRAKAAIDAAPDGYVCTLSEPKKRRIQEERYHAMVGDIAAQIELMGRKWDADDAKRLLVDAFAEVMRQAGMPLHQDGRVVPSLDGKRVVQLGIQTRDFYVREASEFIEYLFAFGAEHEVAWTDPATRRELEAAC